MKPKLVIAGLAALAAAVTPLSANAAELIGEYSARLSGQDHYNSKGQPLTTVAQIIRQDRANYHQFGLRDYGDQDDPVFTTPEIRAGLEALVAASNIPPNVANAIINGDPNVVVQIWGEKGVPQYVVIVLPG